MAKSPAFSVLRQVSPAYVAGVLALAVMFLSPRNIARVSRLKRTPPLSVPTTRYFFEGTAGEPALRPEQMRARSERLVPAIFQKGGKI
jgi:hypothetical protein